jgi:hypothetical protein
LKFIGCHIIAVGDFDGQLCPIADQTRLDQWKQLPKSDFMHDLCNGLHVELQTYYRGTDYGHFDFIGSLYPKSAEDEDKVLLPRALAEARRRYPIKTCTEIAETSTTLCITDAKRIQINHQRNLEHAPPNAIYVSVCKEDDVEKGEHTTSTSRKPTKEGAQDMKLWPGIILLAAVTEKKLKNALRYRVIEVDHTSTKLVQIDDDDKTKSERGEGDDDILLLPTQEVPHKMRLSYAITYDSSQARTLRGGVILTQTDSTRMSLRRLIVGIGRAPNGADVQIY